MIAPVTLFFPAKGGGLQHCQVMLANAMVARGIPVECVMPQASGPFLRNLLPEIPLIDLKTTNRLMLVVRLAARMRATKPRALISAQTLGAYTAVAARAISGSKAPIIAVEHTILSEDTKCSTIMARFARPQLAKLAYSRADRVVATSRGAAHDLASISGIQPSDIAVIPGASVPSDLDRLMRCPTGDPWLDHDATPAIIAAGNLRPVKDHDTLIRAFAMLRKIDRARLVILGEGEERSKLERLTLELGISDDVRLAGHVDNPFAYMARANVFVQSSKHEGFPLALVEALACGCRIVSTDCPYGPRELLDGGHYGRLVPVGNVEDLARAMRIAIGWPVEPSEKTLLRQRAAEFSVERITDQYINLIKEAPNHACLGYPEYGYMESLRPSKKYRLDWWAVAGTTFLVSAFGGVTLAYSGWLQ